ncbi:MAG: GtrA family protein [Puniceicoccales bacterium]|jgi:putative flippase GtrA|nr:GtrA family protein [Puniceicoccales bacterium]
MILNSIFEKLTRRSASRARIRFVGPEDARQVEFALLVPLAFVFFCLIGAVNTLLHLGVLAALSEGAALVFAMDSALREDWQKWFNGAAFLVANVFSYFANSRWSFRAETGPTLYLKFAMTSLAGFLFSVGIMHVGVEILNWHYLVVFIPQTILMPFLNFSLLRVLVFRPANDGSAKTK